MNRERRGRTLPLAGLIFLLYGLALDLEHYAVLGSFDQLLPRAQQEHAAYAVADYERHGFSLNLGVGRGLTSVSDRWVVKAIVGFRSR